MGWGLRIWDFWGLGITDQGFEGLGLWGEVLRVLLARISLRASVGLFWTGWLNSLSALVHANWLVGPGDKEVLPISC